MKITKNNIRSEVREILYYINETLPRYHREQIIEEAMENEDVVAQTRKYISIIDSIDDYDRKQEAQDELYDFLEPILTNIIENI